MSSSCTTHAHDGSFTLSHCRNGAGTSTKWRIALGAVPVTAVVPQASFVRREKCVWRPSSALSSRTGQIGNSLNLRPGLGPLEEMWTRSTARCLESGFRWATWQEERDKSHWRYEAPTGHDRSWNSASKRAVIGIDASWKRTITVWRLTSLIVRGKKEKKKSTHCA